MRELRAIWLELSHPSDPWRERQELPLVGVWINAAILLFLDVIKLPTEEHGRPDRPRLEVRAELFIATPD
jgi:hypothetical protein